MRKARILNVMLGRGRGGLEQMYIHYAEAAMRAGYESYALHDEKFAYESFSKKIFQTTLRQYSQFDLMAATRLGRVIARISPHLIVSHGNRALRLVSLANIFCKKKHITVLHNYRIKNFSHLHGVIALTEDLKNLAIQKKFPESKIALLPNFLLAPQDVGTKEQKSTLVFGFMGRHVPAKGIDILIEAVKKLAETRADFLVIIAGSGPECAQHTQRVESARLQKHIQFTGWVDDKKSFLHGLDALIVPSRLEPFGLVYLEAWQHGLPVLATPNQGARAIVSHGVNGLVAHDMSAQALAALMFQILHDRGTLAALRRGAAESYHAYAWPGCAQNFKATLEKFMASAE